MLKNINPLLGPDLLHTLRSMGHGDEIAIVDANFPADSNAERLVRMDGHSATDVLEAILSVMPLDTVIDCPALRMEMVGDPDMVPPVCADFQVIINKHEGKPVKLGQIERFAFYERAQNSYAIIATGELRLYGNIILQKGVIGPDGVTRQ